MEKTLTQTPNQDYFIYLNDEYNNGEIPLNIATPFQMGAKRMMDRIIALIVLVFILSWFYPLMWI